MSSRTRQQLEAYLKTLDIETGSVLDIGGSQNPIEGRLGSLKADSVDILDLEHPHEFKAKADFEEDIGDPFLRDRMKLQESMYDVAFCIEVMEYVLQPMVVLLNIGHFLKKGGTLYISFPFVYPVHNPYGEDYLRYTEFGAKRLLSIAGFEVEETHYRTAHAPAIMGLYKSEGMRPSQDYKHHDAVGFVFKCTKK